MVSDILVVRYKDFMFQVCVESKRRLLLAEISPFIAGLDTGYDVAKTQDILRNMYKAKNIDWSSQYLYLYLLMRKEYEQGQLSFDE